MRVRDMAGIRAAKFGQHTKLVHTLARAVERLADALWRKRVPVLVVVEKDGSFNVYGHKNAEVEIVHVPSDWDGARRDTLEEWIDAGLPPTHVNVHLSACWLGAGAKKFCVPMHKLKERYENMKAHADADYVLLQQAKERLVKTAEALARSNEECGF